MKRKTKAYIIGVKTYYGFCFIIGLGTIAFIVNLLFLNKEGL